ncbi:MAG: nicotinate (nicotinamide) nucleotide adenylyltransferase [Chloroflexi bacterium]|nr:nicotinate (nicotinamide) nucleotide adenylyltransferase [Chloroflexota bacterium]
MNIGILGGTFDPIHLGHLSIAQSAMKQAELERVLFIPAGHPRFKQAEPTASVEQRLEMVRLATANTPSFEVCDIEATRPGPTYSIDTLVELTADLGSNAKLFFIVGLDVLNQLHRWKDPERVLALCQLLVLDRPGEQSFDWDEFYQRVPEAKGQVQTVAAPLIDVSATELRRRLATGGSVSGLWPDAVAGYILSRKR